jgi:nitrogen fixation negative regulator NifL
MAYREVHKEKMAAALGAFLSAPPTDISVDLLEAFGAVVQTTDGILPPRVFFQAVEQSPVAISITDTKANILYTNAAFERLTGYSQTELIGQNQSILSYKVTPIEMYQDLWAHLLKQKPWNGVLINKRKDGERYLADLTVAPVLGVENKTSYFLAMHRDVTDVHELEQQVQNQKVLIESVVDLAPVFIALLNTKGEVLLSNQFYDGLSQALEDEHPEKRILAALEDQVDTNLKTASQSANNFVNKEIRLRNKEEVIWLSCSGVWVNESTYNTDEYFQDSKSRCLLLVASDITQLKQQQEQVRANAMRAMMAEQQLTYGMREALQGAIFQLQAPMNMLSATLAIAQRRDENMDDPLHKALAEVMRTGETVIDNLNTALPQEIVEASIPVNMNEVVREVLSLCTKELLSQGIQIDLQMSPELPSISGRPNQLCSLLKQLVDNAIQAMSDADRRDLRVSTYANDHSVVVSLRDTGIGVDANQRFKIFEPFFSGWQQKRNHAGMGLTIAQEVARSHGGNIEIVEEHRQRQGTLVRLTLPLK